MLKIILQHEDFKTDGDARAVYVGQSAVEAAKAARAAFDAARKKNKRVRVTEVIGHMERTMHSHDPRQAAVQQTAVTEE